MGFRSKIFLGQLLVFIIFILLLFPFIGKNVTGIVHRSMRESTEVLISKLKATSDQNQMIEILSEQERYVFFRISLLNAKGELIYDSHVSKLLGEKFTPLYPTEHPEVEQALKNGYGYSEGYSQVFETKFAYTAQAFAAHDQIYILRAAFPYAQVQDLIHHFEVGFLILACFVLLLFTVITWIVFARFSAPIQQIIKAIKPYQEGKQEEIPQIDVQHASSDFKNLAHTLNSLSEKIRSQIGNITEERNEKEAILESLGEGVIAVDAKMSVRYVNFTGSKMLGIPKRHLLGKQFPQEEEKPLLEKSYHLLQLCQEKQMVLTDAHSVGDGKKLYLDLIAAPISQGTGAILVLQDKSSNYKILEMGKDFVANASHELRTPITIIKGFAETLQDLPEISQEMLKEITEKIVRNCERMDNLVKNLLTLADIENLPDNRFRACDLIAIIEHCRHILLSFYPEAHVQIETDKENLILSADPDLLELAIMNLVNNAAKYSKPPAQITISVQEARTEVKISIMDKGIGIPEADQEHIFERFYTVDKARSRRLGGAGLGLSIVKTIIEKHDGTISVTSAVGVGTTFIITLPTHPDF